MKSLLFKTEKKKFAIIQDNVHMCKTHVYMFNIWKYVCYIKRAHVLTFILYISKTYVIFNMYSTRVLHMLNNFLTYVKHVFK